MAAHAGVLFFDGRSGADAAVGLSRALEPMSPDGDVSIAIDGSIAMAHAAFHVWAGERSCRQPARSTAGLVITWDGRLDNRHDLLLRLGPLAGGAPGDAAIAAAAFDRWGSDGLRALVGDWSLAIWDHRRRTLHLARDYMGVRPLYYHADERQVLWSSSLEDIVRRAGRGDALSDEFAARFMAQRLASDITPYEGIRTVPAATCLSFSQSGAHTRQRFYELNPGTVRFRDPRQYEEQLRALWSDAVASRLRTGGTAWAELSGGLDSSSVVCMADALIKARRVEASSLQTLSYVTLESPEGDERRFIAEVEGRTGVASAILGVEANQQLIDPDLNWLTPFAVSGVALAGARHVGANGGRVVLSGRAGDVVMGCEPDNSIAVLDDLAAGHVLTALGNLRRWSQSTKKPFVELAIQLARRGTRSGFSRAFEQRSARQHEAGTALLTSRLQQMFVNDRALASLVSPVHAAQRELASRILAYSAGSPLSRQHRPFGAVPTYSYTHRPLVEFVLAIPAEQLSAPGELRWLMRRAFDGVVPARILRRVSKGYYPPSTMRAARVRANDLLPVERFECVRRDWIDPGRLEAAIRQLTEGGGSRSGEVDAVLRLEQWLESRTRRAPAAIPQRKEVRSHEVLNA